MSARVLKPFSYHARLVSTDAKLSGTILEGQCKAASKEEVRYMLGQIAIDKYMMVEHETIVQLDNDNNDYCYQIAPAIKGKEESLISLPPPKKENIKSKDNEWYGDAGMQLFCYWQLGTGYSKYSPCEFTKYLKEKEVV